jgi:hypothetical protein
MGVFVKQNASICNFNSSEIWTILSPIEQRIKAKIESIGTPLKDWDINIYRGVLTGYNEAFIISGEKRKELIEQDSKSEEIIRPILRGRDIKRYSYDFADLYLITTFPTLKINIEKYPAVKKHLLSFGIERLEQTGKKYIINGKEIKSRKKTNNKWFETQDQIGYWEDFYKQKIVYSETNNINETKIVFDDKNFMTDKTAFIIVGNDIEYIYKLLSSKLFTWYMKLTSPNLGSQGISLTKESVETFPCSLKADKSVEELYQLTEEEIKFISSSVSI